MCTRPFSFPGMLMLFAASAAFYGCRQEATVIPLAGNWEFRMDPHDSGLEGEWNAGLPSDANHPAEKIRLPGSMAGNDKGNEPSLDMKWTGSIYDSSWYFDPEMAPYRQPGNLKFPFWLTPVKYYAGPAWYSRKVDLPADWKGRRIVLFLERVHTASMLWVDGKEAGTQNSLVAPHVYDLTGMLSPGTHTLCLRIDNRIQEINVGPDSHSITDHTQGNWNGVIGKIELESMPLTWIDRVQVYPDLGNARARIRVLIGDLSGDAGKASIRFEAESFNTAHRHRVRPLEADLQVKNREEWFEFSLPMGTDFLPWDEFDPALYRLKVTLWTEKNGTHELSREYGMREFSRKGTRFAVNGRPVFLRGNVNCAAFPLTGYPPMDEGSWEKLFRLLKTYGLNHVRYHSWCPPEAAFAAADRVGFYLQPEGPTWPNHGVSLGDGLTIDRYLYDETHRMERFYGNHPSWVMLAGGNEPAGRNQVEYLDGFVRRWKESDPRRLYTGASVGSRWPWVPEEEYIVRSGPRGLPWKQRPQTIFDHRRFIEQQSIPYVSHEIGQYCAFPDFKEIDRYTGVMKARNFELFRDLLEKHDMGDEAEDFLMASGKLQLLCYKNEIEAALRTPGFAGFQMLELNDFPGQGTALVGVLSTMYREKGYASAAEFSRFCNSTVPLARIPKFVYYNTDTFRAAVEMFHFGPAPLEHAKISWKITDSKGDVLASESVTMNLPVGNNIPVTDIRFPLRDIREASRLNFEAGVEGTPFVNDWDFWVYPEKLPGMPDPGTVRASGEGTEPGEIEHGGILFSEAPNGDVWKTLERGGKVFLHVPGKIEKGKDVVMYFSPVFWNTSWFQMRPPHVTGIHCNAEHPVFRDFPTEGHSDLQWWEILHGQQVMLLDSFPPGFRPLIQPIDTWFLSRKLGCLLEARVGKGKIMVCSLDLLSDPADRPAARQLLYSIINYMESDEFEPEASLTPKTILDLFREPGQGGYNPYTRSGTDDLIPVTK